MGLFKKSCWTNPQQPAPNPNPSRWELLEIAEFTNGYALKVRYLDCTNFEGEKVMVFRGEYRERAYLDPHFQPNKAAPIARFRPDDEGWGMAISLAESL